MSDLKVWQESFLDAVQGISKSKKAMQSLLIEEYGSRIDIYADCSHETFVQALRLSYPHTLQLLGEDCFYVLASDFIATQGVSENSLDDFGVQLPDFLSKWLKEKAIDSLGYLSQLSSIDWLIQQVYYAADAEVFNLTTYAKLTEESQSLVCFDLAPSIQLMTSEWPLKLIIDWHEQGANTDLDIQPVSEHYLIWREQWTPKIEVLTQAQYDLLLAIQQGQNLSELAEGKNQEELASLSSWIQKGWISGFYLSSTNQLNKVISGGG